MARVSVNDVSKSLLDAPPSSPEFIIKKPHDEPKLRPKQWNRDIHSIPPSSRMAFPLTESNTPNRRVIRTYSKRNSSSLAAGATEQPPAKRQKSGPRRGSSASVATITTIEEELPLLLPPSIAPKKMAGAGQPAIDGYFSAAAGSSSPRSSVGQSSSGLLWSDPVAGREAVGTSPPSSPPSVRRWTSPRRLKIRPSLVPIAGEQEEEEKDVDDERRVTLDKFFKPRIGRSKTNESSQSSSKGDAVKKQRKPIPKANPSQSKNKLPPPNNPTSKTSPQDAEATVPAYTMPYQFYLNAATASSSSSTPTKAAALPSSAKQSTAATRKVQTTLNLSTKLPFKECKLCDTVYNPLHPADVKLHQVRHARVTGEGGGAWLAGEAKKGKGKGRRGLL